MSHMSKYPLHEAFGRGQLSLAKQLVKKEKRSVNDLDGDLRTPLHHAARGGHAGVLRWAVAKKKARLNAADAKGWTPLHDAAEAGQLEAASFLLDAKGARADQTTADGNTLLHYLARAEELQHYGALEALIRKAVQKGGRVDAGNKNGQTPLFYAARAGVPRTVLCLLSLGAAPSHPDALGETPLHAAVRERRYEAAKALLGAGADANARSHPPASQTPYELAVSSSSIDLARLLISYTADTSMPLPSISSSLPIPPTLSSSQAPSLGPAFHSHLPALQAHYQGPGYNPASSIRSIPASAPITSPPLLFSASLFQQPSLLQLQQPYHYPHQQPQPQQQLYSQHPHYSSPSPSPPPLINSTPLPLAPIRSDLFPASSPSTSPMPSISPSSSPSSFSSSTSSSPQPNSSSPRSLFIPWEQFDLAFLDKPIQLKDQLDEYLRRQLRGGHLAVGGTVLHVPVEGGWAGVVQTNLDFFNLHVLLVYAHLTCMRSLEPHVLPASLHPVYRFHAHSALESTWLCCRVALKLHALPQTAAIGPTLFLSSLALSCRLLERLGCLQQMVPFAVDVLYYLRRYDVPHPLYHPLYRVLNAWSHYLVILHADSKTSTAAHSFPSWDQEHFLADFDRARTSQSDLVADLLETRRRQLEHKDFADIALSDQRLLQQLMVHLQAEEPDRVLRDPFRLSPSCLPDPQLLLSLVNATRPTLSSLAARMLEALVLPPSALNSFPSFCSRDQLPSSSSTRGSLFSTAHPSAVLNPSDEPTHQRCLRILFSAVDGALVGALLSLFQRTLSSRIVFCAGLSICHLLCDYCSPDPSSGPVLDPPIFSRYVADFKKALYLMLLNDNAQLRYSALVCLSQMHRRGLVDFAVETLFLDHVLSLPLQPLGSFPHEIVVALLDLLHLLAAATALRPRVRALIQAGALAALMDKWAGLRSVKLRLLRLLSHLASFPELLPLLQTPAVFDFLFNHSCQHEFIPLTQQALWLLTGQTGLAPAALDPQRATLLGGLLADIAPASKGPLQPSEAPRLRAFKIPSLLFRAQDLYLLGVLHQQADQPEDAQRCFFGSLTTIRELLRWFPRHRAAIRFLTASKLDQLL